MTIKYVVESPEIIIRKLLSIEYASKKKKVEKFQNMLKTCFLTKKCMFSPKSQNAQHVRTCIIQICIQVKYILK